MQGEAGPDLAHWEHEMIYPTPTREESAEVVLRKVDLSWMDWAEAAEKDPRTQTAAVSRRRRS